MADAASPSTDVLVGKARRSSLLLFGQRIGGGVIRLSSSIALAGLLFPEAFGLMVLVNVFVIGLNLFSDTGIGPSMVRSQRGEEPAFYCTAWTVQIVRGALLAALCVFLAGPYAAVFEKHELVPLITIAALSPLMEGFRSPHWFTADRRQTLGRKVTLELIAHICGAVAMVVWAAMTGSVIALVIGGVVQSSVISIGSHFVLDGGPVRPRWDREAARELYSFGRWIFLSTALTFLAMQSDRLLLGGLSSAFWLGLYGISSGLLSICTSFIHGLSSSVIFPTWMSSKRLDEKEHLLRMLRSRKALLCVATAGLVGLTAGVPGLFRIFYDERYQGVIPLVQLLCVSAWFATLTTTSTAAALVFGDSRSTTLSNSVVFFTKIPFGLLGFLAYDIVGFLLATALSNLLGTITLARALKEHGLHLWRQDRDQSLLTLLYLELAILPSVLDLGGIVQLGLELVWGGLLMVAALWPARDYLRSIARR
jgi:O-antigen/teichoic acid export membrane protein